MTNNSVYEAARNEILEIDRFPDYLIRDPRSIAQIIRSLAEKRCMVSVYITPGLSFVSAVLGLSANGEEVILDSSPDQQLQGRALEAETLTCVTRLDGIRVQFTLDSPYQGFEEGLKTILCALPEVVLRLQRREFYRLPVPVNNPVTCQINLPQADGSMKAFSLRALDISNGGVSLLMALDELPITPGMLLEHCLLSIPDSEPAPIILRVRNRFNVESRTGSHSSRLGCEFQGLSARLSNNIQRYIFKVERERRALQPGA